MLLFWSQSCTDTLSVQFEPFLLTVRELNLHPFIDRFTFRKSESCYTWKAATALASTLRFRYIYPVKFAIEPSSYASICQRWFRRNLASREDILYTVNNVIFVTALRCFVHWQMLQFSFSLKNSQFAVLILFGQRLCKHIVDDKYTNEKDKQQLQSNKISIQRIASLDCTTKIDFDRAIISI